MTFSSKWHSPPPTEFDILQCDSRQHQRSWRADLVLFCFSRWLMKCYRSRLRSEPRKVLEKEREWKIIQIHKPKLHKASLRNSSCTNQRSGKMSLPLPIKTFADPNREEKIVNWGLAVRVNWAQWRQWEVFSHERRPSRCLSSPEPSACPFFPVSTTGARSLAHDHQQNLSCGQNCWVAITPPQPP